MKRKSLLILSITLIGYVSLIYKCSSPSTVNVDQFYIDKGEWDVSRIPLIKPYEAIITNRSSGWIVNLKEDPYTDSSVSGIQKINVYDNNVYLYITNTLLYGIKVKKSWYFICPQKNIQKGFVSHQDYVKYLNSQGVKVEPKLYEINDVVQYFYNHEVLNWSEINRQGILFNK